MIKGDVESPQRMSYAEEKLPLAGRKIWSALLWEARLVISWTWILPLLIVPISFYFAYKNYTAELLHNQAVKLEGIGTVIPAVLDYGSALRGDLERFLPLVCIFLVAGLIAQEWRRGTLLQLAVRKQLHWFLLVRLGYILSYLFVLVFVAALVGWNLSPNHRDGVEMWLWIWQTMLITLASTVLFSSIGLLVVHAFVNMPTGYIIPACLWFANWLVSMTAAQAQTKNNMLSFLLFGWYDRTLTDMPDNWLPGKIVLCMLAILLLLCQFPLLRQEARFLRSTE